MTIEDILSEKRLELLKSGNPFMVQFTLDEINALADVNELRRLKLLLPFPENFKRSSDLFACTKHILEGDGEYRVLEFCILKNKILRMPISQVFTKILG